MRGAGDPLTIGERVTLTDLLGQPTLLEDEHRGDDVPAVRDALMAPRRLSRTLFAGVESEYVDPAPVASWAENAFTDYQGGRIGRVVAALPRLIETAQRMEAAGGDRPYRRRCAAVSARVHHLAATTLAKIGEADLGWIAAERAMQAADIADDPLVLASAARSATHALLAVGRFEDALRLGTAAAGWLAPRMKDGDPAALSLYGMLHLRSAIAAARQQDRSLTNELLAKAETAAHTLGTDANHWATGFGPTNVALHRISASLDLGDVPLVVEQAGRVDTGSLPVERQVVHLIDYARALSLLARDDDALQVLWSAEEKSPQLVRHSALAREVVRTLYRRAPVTGGRRSALLLALAQRCRAVDES
ncbi:transcriptional regulator [Actinophytocola xanthii]|uniref:Transcriptional regulator n=1 Tax=Actinophytocola xanthii TaxID=1912961 RepID=A0A1Q8C3K7_9PSEU|nr:transcriptional regulator [Actinophytocola xanthii]OLF08932.1 transcriptional regulator [Actinophytocola xanthii]